MVGLRDVRWQRVEEVFALAVARPAEARAELLTRECGDDAELRAELESLLAHADGDRNLRRPVAAAAGALASVAPPPSVGARVGPYRLIELIGEGGMGTVYLAERDDAAYRRRVAIKILRHGLGSAEAAARFRDERQMLASLDHPAIVRLLDGGTTEHGLPYLVMEHVDGAPLLAHARGRSVRARVALVRAICGAIQHAHQKLIVHRDIKPGNVLVDAAGAPKLLDFGIGKLLDDGAGREAKTRTGAALLTVEYASPEQARGEPVTVATDVYALGAVLYELLVGAPPQRAAGSMLETLRTICEVEPPRPSVAAPSAARRELVGDLDNIVLRALQKAPAARYPSAVALADDLDRYLDGRPVAARPPTVRYRAGKFARRHRGKLAAAALVAAALTTATAVSIIQAGRARANARLAIRQTAVAEAQTRSLLVEQARQELAEGRASRALPYLVEVLRQGEDTPAIRFLLAEALRPLELEIGEGLTVRDGLVSATWSPDGRTIALAGWGGVMLLADDQLRVRARLDSIPGQAHLGAMFTPDGRLLVAAARAPDHEPDRFVDDRLLVWDVATGALRHRWDEGPRGVFLAVDDRYALVTGRDGARLRRLADGEVEQRWPMGPPRVAHGALLGGRLALVRDDGALEWWDIATARRVARVELGAAAYLLPSGERLHACDARGRLHAFDGPGAPAFAVAAHQDPCAVRESPAGDLLVTVAGDQVVRLWDRRTGAMRGTIAGGRAGVRSLEVSPDGRRLAMAVVDNTFQVWDLASLTRETLVEAIAAAGDAPHSMGGAMTVSFSPDGTQLLTASGTDARRWRLSSAPLLRDLPRPFPLWGAAWSPDERRVAMVGYGAGIFDADSGALLHAIEPGTSRVQEATWSQDGRLVVLTGFDGAAVVFSAEGARLRALVGHHGTVNGSAFSPDDRRLVTSGDDGAAIVWDPATGEVERRLQHPGRVLSAAWTADGAQIVTAGWDRTLRIWDAGRGELVRELAGGATQFLFASPSPDGARLASGGHDGEVTVWELATGRKLSLEGHTGPVSQVAWSPDGRLLASAGADGNVLLWDPLTGRKLAARPHPSTNLQVWWSRDGERLLTVNHEHGVRIWSVARERRSVAELLEVAAARSPWRLVGTRLVRAR